ncbi:MAG TPA: hypothetical protein VF043_31880 [Ktedonobacteraceae bacterium]
MSRYVGSSQDNSEISLALGYNGINRLLGQFGLGGRTNTNAGTPNPSGNANGNSGVSSGNTPPAGGFGGGVAPNRNGGPQVGGGSAGAFDTGTPGPLRLFNYP